MLSAIFELRDFLTPKCNFHSDSSLKNDAINISKIVVTSDLECTPLGLGFSKTEIRNGIHGDDWFEIILDPDIHLNHPKMSEQGFRDVKWSPLGMDHIHRCVLVALGINTTLKIFSRHSTRSSWREVVDLKTKWNEIVSEKDFLVQEDNSDNVKDKVSHRAFLLTPMALSWTPLFANDDGSNTSLLLMGLKSGHVAIWRVKAPLSDQDDVCLAASCDTGCELLSTILWCDQGSGTGFFVCGCLDGVARACFVEVNGCDVSASLPVCLWSEKDNIPVSHIAWDKKRHVLVIAKGYCLLLYNLPLATFNIKTPNDQLTEFVSIKTLRLTSHHPIAGLAISAEVLLISSGDGILFTLGLDDFADQEQLELKQMRLSTPEYREKKMPISTWLTNGFALSPNATHLFLLTRPAVLYDHLIERLPMKLQIIPMFSSLEDEVLRVAPKCENSLSDVFVSVRSSVVSKEPLPQLELESEVDLVKAPVALLRVAWLIKHIRVTSNGPFLGEQLDESEIELKNFISRFLFLEYLQKYLKKDFLSSKTLCDRAKTCVVVLKSFVQQNRGINRCSEVMSVIEEAEFECELKEKCRICSASVPFTNLTQDTCPNGHTAERCCQTLLLCQEIKYRKCSFCGSLALNRITKDDFFQSVQHSVCSFCGGFLCNS